MPKWSGWRNRLGSWDLCHFCDVWNCGMSHFPTNRGWRTWSTSLWIPAEDGLGKSSADWQFIATHFPVAQQGTNNWTNWLQKTGETTLISLRLKRVTLTHVKTCTFTNFYISLPSFTFQVATSRAVLPVVPVVPSGGAWPGSVERSCHDLRSGPDPHGTSAYPRGGSAPIGSLGWSCYLFCYPLPLYNIFQCSFSLHCGFKKVTLDLLPMCCQCIANAWPMRGQCRPVS